MNVAKYRFTEAYQSLAVAAILQDATLLAECRDAISPEYFALFSEQEIVRLAATYYDQYRQRPGRDTMVQLIYDKSYRIGWKDSDRDKIVTDLYRIYSTPLQESDLSMVRQRVSEFGKLQALKIAMMDSINVIAEYEKGDDKADLQSVERKIQKALVVGSAKTLGTSLTQVMPRMGEFIRTNSMSSTERRVLTGYPSIDGMLRGGLGGGELGFILAPSNKGKSMVMANFAAAAFRQGKNTLYFSFEMKEPEIASRIAANLTGNTITEVQEDDPTYLRKVKDMEPVFGGRNLKLIYIKPSEATPNNLRSIIMNIEATEGWSPEAMFVDYIDEMTVPAGALKLKDDDSYQTLAYLSAELLSLGVDYRCPVWSASQVNRDGYQGDPELSDTGQSMRKIDKAEFVMSLIQTEHQAKEGRMTFKVLKNRRGPGKGLRVQCMADLTRALIYEVPQVV